MGRFTLEESEALLVNLEEAFSMRKGGGVRERRRGRKETTGVSPPYRLMRRGATRCEGCLFQEGLGKGVGLAIVVLVNGVEAGVNASASAFADEGDEFEQFGFFVFAGCFEEVLGAGD